MDFIYTERTPNPDSIKFITGTDLTTGGTIEIRDIAEAHGQPLLEELISLPDVASIMVGRNFATVTRRSGEWDKISRDVMRVLGSWRMPPIVTEPDEIDTSDPVVAKIVALLEDRVRPAVAQDGGDVLFNSYLNGILTLEMRGSCNGCPSSMATLQHGIQNLMKHYIPEIKEVRST